jgi:hypothetical protein
MMQWGRVRKRARLTKIKSAGDFAAVAGGGITITIPARVSRALLLIVVAVGAQGPVVGVAGVAVPATPWLATTGLE